MQRSRMVRTAVSLTALMLAAAGGAWALDRGGAAPARGTASPRLDLAAYRSFSGCADLLAYLRSQALPLVGPFGLDQPGLSLGMQEVAPGVARAAVPSAAAAGAPGAPGAAGVPARASDTGASGTGTNVQVAGVDEADLTKKVGDLVLTVAAGEDAGLTVLRASDRRLGVAGRLRTDWRPEQLLVQGSTVLLIGRLPGDRPSGPIPGPVPAPGGETRRLRPVPTTDAPRVRMAEVDVADPAHPRLVRTLDLDGELVGARLAEGVVRLAVSSAPTRLRFVTPDPSASGSDGLARALDANRRVVRTAAVTDWLPRWTLTPATGRATSGSLLDCDHVGVPAQFSGLGTLSMLTFDLRSGGVDRWKGAGVVASGATLYSTGDHTYVATQAWAPPLRPRMRPDRPTAGPARVPRQRTLVHAFETVAGGVRYLGSGTVEGSLLGSYAMDEYQGRLRVATTTRPDVVPLPEPALAEAPAADADVGVSGDAAPPATAGSSEAGVPGPGIATVPSRPVGTTSSSVTVLQLRGGSLERVGRVDGLGPGEVIHGVRFAGPQAYVVTFRQTDPLFVVDLADPAHPRVAGSLHLLGYSAYLHPLGNGLVLGVGQDATADGRRTGLLVSLFDVSEPAAPRLLDRVSLAGAWPQVESDEHAFTYAGGLALLPLQSQVSVVSPDGKPSGGLDAAVVGVRVEGRRLGTPTVLRVGAGRGTTGVDASGLRTFVDGGAVWTVAPASPRPVAAVHDATSLRRLSGSTF